MRRYTPQTFDGRFSTLLDEDGLPPCDPPDACAVCVLFDARPTGETRAALVARLKRIVDAQRTGRHREVEATG